MQNGVLRTGREYWRNKRSKEALNELLQKRQSEYSPFQIEMATDVVAASIEKLSMTQRKNPRSMKRRSSERLKSKQEGVQTQTSANELTKLKPGEGDGDDNDNDSKRKSNNVAADEEEFVLRTVNEDQTTMPQVGEIVFFDRRLFRPSAGERRLVFLCSSVLTRVRSEICRFLRGV